MVINGHQMMRSSQMWWCLSCAAYGEGKFYKLRAPCTRQQRNPTRLKRLMSGLHPESSMLPIGPVTRVGWAQWAEWELGWQCKWGPGRAVALFTARAEREGSMA